jgi:indolepyruvate decarboxylase
MGLIGFLQKEYAMSYDISQELPCKYSLADFIGDRLVSLGLKHYFAIPGDYNLSLLDALLKNKKLQLISCCNELNAGYAADGYSRMHGISVLVVTYSVGGLSSINAIAGAYAEDVPIIVISGAPNTNSAPQHQFLHHTLAKVDYNYVREMYTPVTALSITLNRFPDAMTQFDKAIDCAIHMRKPVYVEVPCNLANYAILPPGKRTFVFKPKSDVSSLNQAVKAAAAMLNHAKKPVLIAGARLKRWNSIKAFRQLVKKSQYGVAAMPDAKGVVLENNSQYMGTYWGVISPEDCSAVIESSDAYLLAGAISTDYTTTGFSNLLNRKKLIFVESRHVHVGNTVYDNIAIAEFLEKLALQIHANKKSVEIFQRNYRKEQSLKAAPPRAKLRIAEVFRQVQAILTSKMVLIADTGDAWFNVIDLTLPINCDVELQMQYGSIGWSLGAILGCQLATKKRVVGFVGDGSFQMTAQALSTIIRYNTNPIIFLVNNGSYGIENQINVGIYNELNNWHYAKLVNVFNSQNNKSFGCKVSTPQELKLAIKKALTNKGASLIEIVIDGDDCNKRLLKWGAHVSSNNAKPPEYV